MPRKQKPTKQSDPSAGSTGDPSDPVETAIEKSEKLAESQLEMARLFVTHGKTDIARRRLQDVIENYGQSDAATEARKLLRRI